MPRPGSPRIDGTASPRRGPLTAACAAWVVAFAVSCGGGTEPAHPNILLVVSDTTRAAELSAYGYPKRTTPHIERLVGEGTRFDNAFTTVFWTLPSHASLFTGLYPSDHQATAETLHLPDRASTLAERLREAGYRTAGFVSNAWISRERGFDQGFEMFVESWADPWAEGNPDAWIVGQAVDWMTERVRYDEPFFVFLNLNMVHFPYDPAPGVVAELSPGAAGQARLARLRKVEGGGSQLAGIEDYGPDDYAGLRLLYEGELRMMDDHLRQLTQALEAVDRLDETVVVFTSDHGESLGEHDRIDHLLNLHDTTMRIPLVIRYPPVFEPGSIRTDLVSLVDVQPTLLDLAGAAREADDAPRRSLARTSREVPAFVVGENDRPVSGIEQMKEAFPRFDTRTIDHRMRMLRTGTHKLIWRSSGRHELYDVAGDPGELVDLAEREPERLAEMISTLETWMAEREDTPRPPRFRSRDENAKQQLRALGYIE